MNERGVIVIFTVFLSSRSSHSSQMSLFCRTYRRDGIAREEARLHFSNPIFPFREHKPGISAHARCESRLANVCIETLEVSSSPTEHLDQCELRYNQVSRKVELR